MKYGMIGIWESFFKCDKKIEIEDNILVECWVSNY